MKAMLIVGHDVNQSCEVHLSTVGIFKKALQNEQKAILVGDDEQSITKSYGVRRLTACR
jgi:hypothetical protein